MHAFITELSMSDDAILTSRDKEILQRDADPDEFSDFNNRISKIRSRVNRRREALVSEIELLRDFGEEELVEDFLSYLSDNTDNLSATDLKQRVERLSRDLDRIEESCSELSSIRDRLTEIEQELDEEI